MKSQTIAAQFDEWLGAINYSEDDLCGQTYPFFLRVGCVKACPPRHERFEYIKNMGMSRIEDVMQGNPLNSDTLTFVFPERHMSVHEQQAFMMKLACHPDAMRGNIKTVDILTSSAIMISSFHREQILILQWEDDDHYLEACK
mgnify:CR=1 FL=1